MKSPASLSGKPGTTILLVDDDEDLLLVLDLKLKAEGYNTLVSVNGKDVKSISKTAQPDVVLLDITMNGVSGESICRMLKAEPDTRHIPVILFSANFDIREITESCGADDYLTKPLDFADLRQKVNKLIPPTDKQTTANY